MDSTEFPDELKLAEVTATKKDDPSESKKYGITNSAKGV